MEKSKNMKIPEQRFFHILRHYTEIDNSYYEILKKQGYDDFTIKQACNSVGSKFNATIIQNPLDLMQLKEKGNIAFKIEQANDNDAISVKFDFVVGSEGILSILELSETEKQFIKESKRNGIFIKSIKLPELKPTNQITYIINKQDEIITAFPGRYAPPLPFSNMPFKEKKTSIEFWLNHVFIEI